MDDRIKKDVESCSLILSVHYSVSTVVMKRMHISIYFSLIKSKITDNRSFTGENLLQFTILGSLCCTDTNNAISK